MIKKSKSISINILSVFVILTCLLLGLIDPINAWFTDQHHDGIYISVTVSNLNLKVYQNIDSKETEIYTNKKNEEHESDGDTSTKMQFIQLSQKIEPVDDGEKNADNSDKRSAFLSLKLKNEDQGETSVYLRFKFQLMARGVAEDIEIPIQIYGFTAATASAPGFVKEGDYYYYKENSLEGAANARFAKGAGIDNPATENTDESIYLLQSFNVPFSSFFDVNGNMKIKNSETVYIKLTIDESAEPNFE